MYFILQTFGNLNPKSIRSICRVIKNNWNRDFGFHAHDNCGLAFKNCLTANAEGAKWIDSTIQGMGRGAGNLKTEEILKYLSSNKINNYNFSTIEKLAKTDFQKLKLKYNWANLTSIIFQQKNIHPSYIQVILADKRYNKKEIVKIINQLSKIKSSSFNPIRLQNIVNDKLNFRDCWNAKEWCNKKNILILGQGNSIKKNYNKIINFIKKSNAKFFH